MWLIINTVDGLDNEDFARLRLLYYYPGADFFFLLFCVESKETLQNCFELWMPELSHNCPGVPIVLVGVSHCFRPLIYIDPPPSNRRVSEEEGNEAAKKIGKII